MKIIITGAAGGIGSILSEHLNNKGHDLTLIDNLTSGKKSNFRNQNLVEKLNEFDLTYLEDFKYIFENADYIVHLAGTSSLPECQEDTKRCFDNNVDNTIKILEMARIYSCKVIFASTSAVYENNVEKILNENLVVDPSLNYSLSKYTSEKILKSYSINYGVKSVALRLFNTFGPNQNVYRKNPPLINYILHEVSQEKNPTIFSDLKQSRDYVTVYDVVKSIEILLNKDWKSNFEVYNICSGELISIEEILSSVQKSLEHEINIIKGEPTDYWRDYNKLFSTKLPFNTERIKKELTKSPLGSNSKFYDHFGWKPTQSVIECIEVESKKILKKLRDDGN